LEVTDRVTVRLYTNDGEIRSAVQSNLSYISAEILADTIQFEDQPVEGEKAEINEQEILISISKV
jgi:isoleucyl-tRNA synthetase